MIIFLMCGILALLNQEIDNNIYKSFLLGQKRGPEYSTLVSGNLSENIILGFHRLAINGLDSISNQPFFIKNCKLICNGEIYNFKDLAKQYNITLLTNSDCEIIIHLYLLLGIGNTLPLLDGVFSFILCDYNSNEIFVARDRFGVRPLFISSYHNNEKNMIEYGFASECKVLNNMDKFNYINSINVFSPGSFFIFKKNLQNCNYFELYCHDKFYNYPLVNNSLVNEEEINKQLVNYLSEAVKKRVLGTSDRPIACLLSGGLDSSLICALVNIHYNSNLQSNFKQLETYSIGLEDSEDLKFATLLANYLGTSHTNIKLTEDEFFNSIPEVIYNIESYDTTTVRASVGNYLIGKYIKNNSNAKVIFNGDGADELMGGYLYFNYCENSIQFNNECIRLLKDIHYFDVLRSDRCISSNGLEPRTPFLDKNLVNYYLNLSPLTRFSNHKCEKYLIRNAFNKIMPNLLPDKILWRKKEAFSDGVSSLNRSWYVIIQEKVQELYNTSKLEFPIEKYLTDPEISLEKAYYKSIYNSYFKNQNKLIPYYWMPKFVDAKDASARTLKEYNKNNNI